MILIVRTQVKLQKPRSKLKGLEALQLQCRLKMSSMALRCGSADSQMEAVLGAAMDAGI